MQNRYWFYAMMCVIVLHEFGFAAENAAPCTMQEAREDIEKLSVQADTLWGKKAEELKKRIATFAEVGSKLQKQTLNTENFTEKQLQELHEFEQFFVSAYMIQRDGFYEECNCLSSLNGQGASGDEQDELLARESRERWEQLSQELRALDAQRNAEREKITKKRWCFCLIS